MKFFYYDNNSFLNKLNPISKIIAPIPLFILLCMVNDFWTPLAFIALTVFIILVLGKIPLTNFLKISAPVLIFSLSILILFLVAARNELTAGSPVLFTIGAFNIYQISLYAGLTMALRIYALLILALPFSFTTEPSNFIRSIIQNLRLPYKFSYGVMVAFRFLPMMETEFNVVRSAHKVMGIADESGVRSYFEKTKRYSVPLLVNAIRIGERTALSMDGRAFGAFKERTFYKKIEFKRVDWLYMLSFWSISVIILLILYLTGLMGELGFYFKGIG
ncbi:MAG: Energy-coupling factor transporter transmembrane protein EcfT [Methanobacterium sp. PtaU1.Bin242]|nr:energy-coupling factor transporter transmembrane protein EcfT [Candidatus Atribacteria bacterium]OPY25208.1 MAG: Energy-coupling factor transporter transmembrane protein EcfT [Methanobacterium sp. PtaU1.Bin242]